MFDEALGLRHALGAQYRDLTDVRTYEVKKVSLGVPYEVELTIRLRVLT